MSGQGLLGSCIAVKSGKQVVDPEVSENDRDEADNGQDGRALSPPVPGDPGMEKNGVHEPGDQRPGLLRVPAPVGTPGVIGPCRPGHNSDGQEGEADYDRLVNQFIQGIQGRKQGSWTALFFPLLLPL